MINAPFSFSSLALPVPHIQTRKKSINQKSDAFSQFIKETFVGRQGVPIPHVGQLLLLSTCHFQFVFLTWKTFNNANQGRNYGRVGPQIRTPN